MKSYIKTTSKQVSFIPYGFEKIKLEKKCTYSQNDELLNVEYGIITDDGEYLVLTKDQLHALPDMINEIDEELKG